MHTRAFFAPYALLVAVVLSLDCGHSTPAAPTPPSTSPSPITEPTPVPAGPVNVAGTWTGTLEATGFATRSIALLAFQGGTCVDGAWRSEPAEWVGVISGSADATTFTGNITIQRPADGAGKCGGVAEVSGGVGADTIRWTSAGFTGDCRGGLPQSIVITLRRE